MTPEERARAFLQTHLGQTISMEMLGELCASFENHLDDERQQRESDGLRAVPDLDEEVDDDSAE